jgi:hypothetical protein
MSAAPLFTQVVYNPAQLSECSRQFCQDIESGLFVEQSAWVDKKLQEMYNPNLLPLCPCPIAWLKRSSKDFDLLEKKDNSVLKKRHIEEVYEYNDEYDCPSVGVCTGKEFTVEIDDDVDNEGDDDVEYIDLDQLANNFEN